MDLTNSVLGSGHSFSVNMYGIFTNSTAERAKKNLSSQNK